jgi:hypothetical protein
LADARCVRDSVASPAPLLGHNFLREKAMRVPCSTDEMAWFLAALMLLSSGIGILVTLLREG